jgi:hypothetical protein
MENIENIVLATKTSENKKIEGQKDYQKQYKGILKVGETVYMGGTSIKYWM